MTLMSYTCTLTLSLEFQDFLSWSFVDVPTSHTRYRSHIPICESRIMLIMYVYIYIHIHTQSIHTHLWSNNHDNHEYYIHVYIYIYMYIICHNLHIYIYTPSQFAIYNIHNPACHCPIWAPHQAVGMRTSTCSASKSPFFLWKDWWDRSE